MSLEPLTRIDRYRIENFLGAGGMGEVYRARDMELRRDVALKLDKARQVAETTLPLLVTGDTGTGKEVVARAVHGWSRRPGRFVALNCGAISAALVESTLFGHRRGAFSGAIEDQPGFVRSADGGTLLLDEIGDLPLPAQAALLRVVQEREVVPVGDTRRSRSTCASSVPRTATSTRSPPRSASAATCSRFAGVRVTLPPLRERMEDMGFIVATVLARAGVDGSTLASDAVWALVRHGWPQNVRELEQAVRSALALSGTGRVERAQLPALVRGGPVPPDDVDRRRRDELVVRLRAHGGNLAALARELGTSRAQVHRLLRRHGIDPDEHR